MSRKHTDLPSDDAPASIVQPIIDELVAQSPPEHPVDNKTPPPRGPLHPPQPAEDRAKDLDESGSV